MDPLHGSNLAKFCRAMNKQDMPKCNLKWTELAELEYFKTLWTNMAYKKLSRQLWTTMEINVSADISENIARASVPFRK